MASRATRLAYDRATREAAGLPRRFRGVVAYDGTSYVGWQTQPSGRGLQDVIEARLSALFGGRVYVAGSGRTDKGVHARGQVFHFEPPEEQSTKAAPHVASVLQDDDQLAAVLERTLSGLSSGLPSDVQVLRVQPAPAGFHARDSCVGKRYVYTVQEGVASPMTARYRWVLGAGKRLDVPAMAEAAARLVGMHDFSTFGVRHPSDPRCPLKRMRRLEVRRVRMIDPVASAAVAEGGVGGDGCSVGDDVVTICAECDRFLYNMMRLLSGTLVQVRPCSSHRRFRTHPPARKLSHSPA